MVQKVMMIGIDVKTAKKIDVNKPPPTLRASNHGTTVPKLISKTLEKDSLPAASAGRGPFLIAGYYSLVDQHST